MDKDELERLLASVELTEEEQNISIEDEMAEILSMRAELMENEAAEKATENTVPEESIEPAESIEPVVDMGFSNNAEAVSAMEAVEKTVAVENTTAGGSIEEPVIRRATVSQVQERANNVAGDFNGYQYEERKRFLTFSKKLVGFCLLPMIFICIIITIFSTRSLRWGFEREIENSLQILSVSLDETYIYISEEADEAATKTSPEGIYGFLESGKGVLNKNVDIQGQTHYSYYRPLVNSDGSVIGAVEVAMDPSSIQKTINGRTAQGVIFSLIFVVIVSVIIMLLSGKMVAAMSDIKEFLAKLATGELGQVPEEKLLQRNDELGDIYGLSIQLQAELRKTVNRIKESADGLVHSANHLTDMALNTQGTVDGVLDSVEEISKGTVTQAEGTATANNNVTKMGEQISYITDEVNSLTKNARQMSDAEKASERIIVELNASNEDTKSSLTKVADQIMIMNESVQSINTAVAMIQSIADETDLLSLNASIEAARAGEAGRGFAVVAEQICKLAEQSNSSATEIEQIINEVMSESDKMVEIMDEVKSNMDHQQAKLEETQAKYNAVAEGVENSLGNIDSIKEKIDVLSGSGTAIKDVVQDLSSISEQNAASAHSTMQAAQDMSETMNNLEMSSEKLQYLADQLNDTLAIFKV